MRVFFFIFCIAFILSCDAQKYESMEALTESIYKNTVPIIQPNSLKFVMDRGSDLVLLDAREPNEYAVSHLKGAKCVGYDNFKMKNVEGIDKDAQIIVYCSVGYRSERIGEKLQKAGFTNVKNLYGGIFEWKNLGHTIYNTADKETEKVHAYDKIWGLFLKNGDKVYSK